MRALIVSCVALLSLQGGVARAAEVRGGSIALSVVVVNRCSIATPDRPARGWSPDISCTSTDKYSAHLIGAASTDPSSRAYQGASQSTLAQSMGCPDAQCVVMETSF